MFVDTREVFTVCTYDLSIARSRIDTYGAFAKSVSESDNLIFDTRTATLISAIKLQFSMLVFFVFKNSININIKISFFKFIYNIKKYTIMFMCSFRLI